MVGTGMAGRGLAGNLKNLKKLCKKRWGKGKFVVSV